jgi:hypothetical protein
MTNTIEEYLVTAQGYKNNDQYKQTILLHDSFFVDNEDSATKAFKDKFELTHTVMNIYSVIKLTNQ